jgi:prepilin signal peptidase PulO-like enzyme (type II secretory pathway)
LAVVALEQLARVMELLALTVFFRLLHPPEAVVVDKTTLPDYLVAPVAVVAVLLSALVALEILRQPHHHKEITVALASIRVVILLAVAAVVVLLRQETLMLMVKVEMELHRPLLVLL